MYGSSSAPWHVNAVSFVQVSEHDAEQQSPGNEVAQDVGTQEEQGGVSGVNMHLTRSVTTRYAITLVPCYDS